MRDIAINDPAIEIFGAADFDVRADGIVPRRLPAWTRPQIPDLFVDTMVGLPSGVRLRFRTDTPFIELDALVTGIQILPNARRTAVFELADGDDVIAFATDAGPTIRVDRTRSPAEGIEFVPGEPVTVCFDGLEPDLRDVEVWLPQHSNVELRGLRVHPDACVEPPTPIARKWVHYGSSISHCMEAERPMGTWPVVASQLAGVNVINLGLAGQCHLDPFVARTIRDLDVDAISIKVGINVINLDSMRERVFVPALHGFIDTIRERHADTPILLISPIICPMAEKHPGPTVPTDSGGFRVVNRPVELREGALTLQRVRTLLATFVDTRRSNGDVHLHYLDGLQLFGEDDAHTLPDGLHPDAAGYRLMGERFASLAFADGAAFGRVGR